MSNLVYFPWPRPWPDLAWWQFALLSLPFTSLLIAIMLALLARCRQILVDGLKRIDKLTGLESVYSDRSAPSVQMAVVRLPRVREIPAFQRELLLKYRIEVPCINWNGQHFIRITVQTYNIEEDIDALLTAVDALLPRHRA